MRQKFPGFARQREMHKGWVCYRYTAAGVTVVPVIVERRESQQDSHLLSIRVPSMFGDGNFGCICWEQDVFETEEEAKEAAIRINSGPQPKCNQ